MILLREPSDWFVQIVEPVPVRETTKAYVVGVFLSLLNGEDIGADSVVLAYARACANPTFDKYQELGDWLLWSLTFFPEAHRGYEEVAMAVGRRSYETCWRILRGRWDLYAELADQLPLIVHEVRTVNRSILIR